MVSEIKFIITENEKVIHTITKETNSQTLVKSLEEFQHAVNAKLTKMIEDLGGPGDEEMESEGEDCEDDDNEDTSILPKKRRK